MKHRIQKIQEHEHGSRSRIAQELVFWSDFLSDEKKAAEWVAVFEFDADDLAFLLQTTPSSAKVKRLVERAEEWKHPRDPSKVEIVEAPLNPKGGIFMEFCPLFIIFVMMITNKRYYWLYTYCPASGGR